MSLEGTGAIKSEKVFRCFLTRSGANDLGEGKMEMGWTRARNKVELRRELHRNIIGGV